MAQINFTPGPTGANFLNSFAFMKLICGPVGGGKSTVALFDLINRAANQKPGAGNVRRTRFIILRNTVAQLKSTVKPLIDQWLVEMAEGQVGYWKVSDNIFVFTLDLPDGTKVESEFWLMAADTPDDVRRLLSVECSAAWVEEAREVNADVFSGLQGRVNRYPNRANGGVTYPGVICSTNPPPVGGFWHEIISTPPRGWEIFMQPPALLDDGTLNPDAENLENLAPDYYDNLIGGKTDDWIDVYLKNQFGAGNYGKPVYRSSFKKSFHVATAELQGIFGATSKLIIGMDNGLQSSAVLTQRNMRGQIAVLDEVYVPKDTTMGVERFMDTLVIPKLNEKWHQFRTEDILFVLDPACFQRGQADETTIAQVVAKRGYQVLKARSNNLEPRIGAVEGLMAGQVDGKAMLTISPCCSYLIEGMEWGYRFKPDKGDQSTAIPEKNHHANTQDAFQYAAMFHYGPPKEVHRPTKRNVARVSSAGWT